MHPDGGEARVPRADGRLQDVAETCQELQKVRLCTQSAIGRNGRHDILLLIADSSRMSHGLPSAFRRIAQDQCFSPAFRAGALR
jgi:hypothetical protein